LLLLLLLLLFVVVVVVARAGTAPEMLLRLHDGLENVCMVRVSVCSRVRAGGRVRVCVDVDLTWDIRCGVQRT
jgi:hypothetical protein